MRYIITILLLLNLANAKNICEDKLFSFNTNSYKNSITILNLLENLVNQCEITMLIENTITRKALSQKLAYINVRDYSIYELFDLLLSEHNIFYKFDSNKNLLKLSYLQTKSFYIDYVNIKSRTSNTKNSIKSGGGKSGGDSTNEDTIETVTEFDFWERIEKDIKALLQRDEDIYLIKSKVFINPEAGLVTATGSKKQIDRVTEYIQMLLDRVHKQIMIEVKILEVAYNKANSTGIDWSKFDLSFLGGANANYQARGASVISNSLNVPINTFGYNFTMDGFISFLKQKGEITVVSNPKVLTLNNQPAVINVGQQINYKTETMILSKDGIPMKSFAIDSVFVGVTLSIVPEVNQDGFIILKVNPVISNCVQTNCIREENDKSGLPPDTIVKQLSSIVKVKNGNRIVIGGLITKNQTISENQVPELGDVPFFGRAFASEKKRTVKSELILVITPKIITGSTDISLEDIDKKFRIRD